MHRVIRMSLAAGVSALALGATGLHGAKAADMAPQYEAPPPAAYAPPPAPAYGYPPPPPPVAYYGYAVPPYAVWPGYYGRYWGYGPRFAYGYGRWGYGRWGWGRGGWGRGGYGHWGHGHR